MYDCIYVMYLCTVCMEYMYVLNVRIAYVFTVYVCTYVCMKGSFHPYEQL